MGFNPRRDNGRNLDTRSRRGRFSAATVSFLIAIACVTPGLAHARAVAESSDLNGWAALGVIAGVLGIGLLLQSTRRLR